MRGKADRIAEEMAARHRRMDELEEQVKSTSDLNGLVRKARPNWKSTLREVRACQALPAAGGRLHWWRALTSSASASWSSRMTMRQAASIPVPWSAISRTRAARRS